jgi:anaerobic magnesium-protoporphyrin IX monomethyl ester cyclase
VSRLDLLLIDPPRVYWGFGGGLGFFSPPVGLATLAGFLEENDVQVDVLDCNAREIGWDTLAAEVVRRDPRCVGVSSSMTCYVPDAFRCLEIVKRINPDICTIGGGLQFSLAPGESFERCESLDVIVRGDGEYSSLELLEELRQTPIRLKKVKGLSFRRGEEIVHNPDRQPVRDLDVLPRPAWHMLPMSEYRLPVVPPEWGNYAIVVTTRGCPYNCSFCSPRAGQAPYRAMSGERVLEMLDDLYYQHDTRVFWFSDLSFNVSSERTERILDGIIERGWKVRLAFDGTRTDLIIRDRHLLPKMKEAGVFLICLGVESYSDQELEDYRKGASLAQAKEAIALIKQHKINTWSFFMLGNPWHDEQDFQRMLDYAMHLDPTIAIFSLVTPMPGTAFYQKMLAQGRIEEFDWSRYDMAHPVLRSDHFTRQQLLDHLDNCYTVYYKRAGKIIRHGIFGDEFARYTYRFLRFVNAVRQIKEGKL